MRTRLYSNRRICINKLDTEQVLNTKGVCSLQCTIHYFVQRVFSIKQVYITSCLCIVNKEKKFQK